MIKTINDGKPGDGVYLEAVDGDEDRIFNAARMSRGVSPSTGEPGNVERKKHVLTTCFQQKHGTPFEFASMTFEIHCPLFVRSQLERYRHCSFVEKSFRACEPTIDNFWNVPEYSEDAWEIIDKANREGLEKYQTLREKGIHKEVARVVLPQTLRTSFVMIANVRELLHIFDERLAPTAQRQTRDYVQVMFDRFEERFPFIANLWKESRSLC